MATTLSAQALNIGYTQKRGEENVVHADLNFSFSSGRVTALLGLNGAGKSTLLRTLGGFQAPLKGDIELFGKPLDSYSQQKLSQTIGVVLTEKTNAGGITVQELVALGRHPYTNFFGALSQEDNRVIAEAIKAVGIGHKAHNFVSELSDGERQKVMIAKTLAQQCPVILLDEPTAFLDVISRVEVMVLLRKLATEQNKTIILSTHDLDLAIEMCDEIMLLEKGAALQLGTPEDLILRGSLTSFFSRDNIAFEPASGRLTTPPATRQIGICEDGDALTKTWVKNALARADYQGIDGSHIYPNINCTSPNAITIQQENGEEKSIDSIAQLLELLR